MSRIRKIIPYLAFAIAFCCLAIGYAAVQDELIVNGIVSVDGYTTKDDLSAADTEGYIYDPDTKTIEIKDIYYNPDDGKNYKVTGIAENGFSRTQIAAIKETNSDFELDAIKIEAFILSEGISQIGANAFNGLSNLKFFNTTKYKNTYFNFEDDILFKLEDDNKCTLVYYSFDRKETYYVVDETKITAITDGAFSNNIHCTAILTSYYDDSAWGSPAAVMISTVGFLDRVTSVIGSVAEGYTVYLENADPGENVVLQGNDDPDSNFYGQPKNELVAADDAGSYISIDKDLCKPCRDHQHYSQIYLSSWQTLAYAYLTEDKTLEIHNCLTAIVGGEIYQWVSNDDDAHRILPNSTLYTLPSGTVNGSSSLPEDFADWSSIKAQVKKVDVIDNIAPTSVSSWFKDMTACTEMDLAKLNTENVTTMSGMFWGCEELATLNVAHFNTSNVKSMSYMFARCLQLTSLDVSSFDTTNVTSMSFMFANGKKLETISLLGTNFSTAEVTTMENMFAGCESLKELNLSHFNTAKVKNMARMFNLNYSLETLSLSSNFTTADVTSMTYMFNDCYALDELDISSFNTNKVTNMDYMFHSCSDLKKIIVSDTFVTRAVSSSTNMFYNCTSLVGGNRTTLETVQATGVTAANSYKATYAKIDKEGQLGYFTAKTAD